LNLPFFGWMHDAIEDYFYFQMEDQVTIDCWEMVTNKQERPVRWFRKHYYLPSFSYI
jgi:hypothetical protein